MCPPADKPEVLTLARTVSVLLLNDPSEAVIEVPAPEEPTESIKYSAAAMFDPPVLASLTVAVSVTDEAPLVGLGDTATFVVTGPEPEEGGVVPVT